MPSECISTPDNLGGQPILAFNISELNDCRFQRFSANPRLFAENLFMYKANSFLMDYRTVRKLIAVAVILLFIVT